MDFEQRFYERVSAIAPVAHMMPRLLGADREARAILLEDLVGARDFTSIYSGDVMTADEIRDLALYLAVLHSATRGEPDARFRNAEMRALNFEHMYMIPLESRNGLKLEAHEPGLTRAALRLKKDAVYMARVVETSRRYLARGRCLVHGDYFPGSWLRTPKGLRVIDAEFCFYGHPEFDVGVAIAHLALGRQVRSRADEFLAAYQGVIDFRPLRLPLISRFAAAEVMRRLIGVAQLPIPPSDGFRAALLKRSRAAMIDGRWEALWE